MYHLAIILSAGTGASLITYAVASAVAEYHFRNRIITRRLSQSRHF